MKSMTGYAYKEYSIDKITVSVELKCYNSRFLDVYVHIPAWLSVMEGDIRKIISNKFVRGKIEAGIRVKDEDYGINVTINENAALAYHKSIKNLAELLGTKEEPSLQLILDMEGVLETGKNRDADKYREIIENVLSSAIEQADADRIREGEHTKADILSHTALIEESAKLIEKHVPEIEESFKETLKTRFDELLGDKIDENRLLAETAVLLVKYSISEELSRLSSHLTEFRQEIDKNQASGKKLDFLSQEINREINTIGSKQPVLEVSRAVVEMKNALENIREQLHNVE